MPKRRPRKNLPPSPIAEQLGCALEDGLIGLFIKVDESKATSVPNVFACGDAARAARKVTLTVADGVMAGFWGTSGFDGLMGSRSHVNTYELPLCVL